MNDFGSLIGSILRSSVRGEGAKEDEGIPPPTTVGGTELVGGGKTAGRRLPKIGGAVAAGPDKSGGAVAAGTETEAGTAETSWGIGGGVVKLDAPE